MLTGGDVGHDDPRRRSPRRTPAAAPGHLRRRTATASTPSRRPTPSRPTSPARAQDGSTLTATRHLDRHRRSPTRYQWQRCDADGADCTDIAGATGSTYDARRRADVGARVARRRHRHQPRRRRHRRPPRRPRRRRRARRQHGAARDRRHRASTAQTLTADRGTLDRHRRRSTTPTSGSAATPTAPNCVDIAGATGSTYDARHAPTSARDRASSSPRPTPPAATVATSAADRERRSPLAPANTTPPSISGDAARRPRR